MTTKPTPKENTLQQLQAAEQRATKAVESLQLALHDSGPVEALLILRMIGDAAGLAASVKLLSSALMDQTG